VLRRAIVILAAALAAMTAATVIAPVPAGATGREAEPLAEAASQALAALRGLAEQHAAATLGDLSLADAGAAERRYQADLTVVAGELAPRTSAGPEAFLQAWSAAGPTRMTVVLAALAQVGVPYGRNSSNPGSSFDCSGLTMYAWSQAGVALPHQDGSQMQTSAPRQWDTALAGDLVRYPGHVMLYLGVNEAIVHAPHSGTVVRVQELGSHRVQLASPID
jgi:cell wall-associated NlpC family hydrolase